MKGSKTKGITILARTRYVFYGGGMASLREGCRLAQDNGRVLIASPGSCLLPELCDTFSWQADAETAALFPEEVRDGGLLQPADRDGLRRRNTRKEVRPCAGGSAARSPAGKGNAGLWAEKA